MILKGTKVNYVCILVINVRKCFCRGSIVTDVHNCSLHLWNNLSIKSLCILVIQLIYVKFTPKFRAFIFKLCLMSYITHQNTFTY